MNFKLNDVYSFRYKPEVLAEAEKYHSNLNHCFDGQLIVKQNDDSAIFLEDTYWVGNSNSNYCFSIEEALKKGNLIFKCNLDKVEPIQEWQLSYYDEVDTFNLSRQHGYYKAFYVRKSAKRSKARMLRALNEKIIEAQNKINFANREIERAKEAIIQVERDNLEVYI